MVMGILGIIAVSLIKAPVRQKMVRKKLSLDRFFLVRAWPIFINQLLPSFAWGTIGPFVAQYGKEINIPNAGIYFLFWAGGIILSRIFAGRLVDRGHIHKVNMIAMVVVALAFFGFAHYHNIYAFCLAGFFIGIGFGMMLPALQTLYINMAEHNQRGTANSTYLVGFDLGLALGMLLGGFISGHHSFEALFMIAGAVCLISVVIYLFVSKPLFDRKRLR
ncbi:Multidrug resistance protein MdtG [bioreactor metagenome]|uniref:Multidrug resistance protein MdtG n=2 Tax=root TaxID=1 RepID=A0A645GB48_9ZZZZ